MKKYENPEIQIESLEVADVITSSVEGCTTETELN